jgi:hypothetical protein
MAQYRIDRNQFLANGNTIYEVVMLADSEGNLTGGGNFHGSAVDAFGRARFSEPYTIFESDNTTGESTKFDVKTVGTANSDYITAESAVNLNVSTGSGDLSRRRSKRRMAYQPGKSLQILESFNMDTPKTNLVQRVGFYDDDNGFFLEQDGTDVYMVKRSSVTGSVVETRVAQSDWNGDTLNGTITTSTSGVVLDLTKSQILAIDIEWLGVGSVRMGFVVDGKNIIAHTFHHANVGTTTYTTRSSLPLTYEILNSGVTASNSVLKSICATVISEGGFEPRGISKSKDSAGGLSGSNVNAAWTQLVSIRLKANTGVVVPTGIDVLNISNVDYEWGLFKNITPNTALTWVDTTDLVQTATGNNVILSWTDRVAGGYLGGKTAPITLGDGGLEWNSQLGVFANGNFETLTLGIRAGSSSKTAAGLIKWIEV